MPDPFDSSDPQRRPRGRISRLFNRVRSRDSRQHLWDFLDLLDERPALKRGLYIGVPVLVLAIAFGFWGYNNWAQKNAYGIARQWLDANRLDRAADAVQNALATEPDRPDSWRLASELAWKKGKRATSVEYAKKAAAVSHYQEDYVLAWAEAAILSDDASQAQEAERYLNPATAQESPRALRLAGEIARRGLRFTDARVAFQSALEADKNAGATYTAIDEIPLGIVSLQTGLAEDRARGISLLSKWASDPTWGAEALRALLADAVAHHDREAVGRLAEGLRTHPHCTLADVPVCLKALADYDPVRYKAMLDPMEDQSRLNPTHAAELMGWLTQIGQAAEAVRWGESLYPAAAQKPPIAPAIAEALHATRRWADLRDWVARVDWGTISDSWAWPTGWMRPANLPINRRRIRSGIASTLRPTPMQPTRSLRATCSIHGAIPGRRPSFSGPQATGQTLPSRHSAPSPGSTRWSATRQANVGCSPE
jgi:tetratricopeptide (TPR) repeat protein